jgi:serine/threonine protein kinase
VAYTFKHGDRPLDRITIQRAVGRGGFGEVYYALMDSGKQVAVKYLRENPEVELRGISQVMNLKSPNLITIYDVLRNEENEPFVIMEYVPGPSLRELLTAEPDGLGPQKAAFFLKSIGEGLSYLHERGIVHRDLKPGNIFYDDGYVKIGDYGLSKHISVSAHSGNTVSVGTVHYMAPEIGSGSYTRAIDIYALGVMLFELLTGKLPHTGASMGEILMRHMNDRPDLVAIPEPFKSVIARALAKAPADRYQDVNEMVDQVIGVSEIGDQIRSFNPATLSGAPRFPDASDEDNTQTAPGRRVPPLPPVMDARDAGDARGFPPIPPIPGMPGKPETGRERRVRRKWEKLQGVREFGRKMLEKDAERDRAVIDQARRFGPPVLAIGIPTIAIGVGLGLLSGTGKEEAAIAMALLMVGGLLGPLVAHFKIAAHVPANNWVLERFLYAASALVFMIPGIAIALEELRSDEFARISIPIIIMLMLFDWPARIEKGRAGRVEGASAIWPGIVGLIAGLPATDGDYAWQAAGACAALALLIPSAAGIFPHRSKPSPGGTPEEEAMLAAAGKYDRGDAPKYQAPPPSSEKKGFVFEVDAGVGSKEQSRPAARPVAQHRQMIDPNQPSFVGRAANAGLSFVGKSLILVGFLLALTYAHRFEFSSGHDEHVAVGASGLHVTDGDRTEADVTVPKWVPVLPFVFGLFLLASARRSDGTLHFLRGVVGCGMGIGAAIVALGPAYSAFGAVFEDKWDTISGSQSESFALAIILASLSFTLIFWPKRPTKRPIVI